MDYIYLAVSWAIFYSLHSVLAPSKLKRILEEKLGKSYKWYRLFYSFFFIILFIGIVIQSLFIPNSTILPKTPFLIYLGYMMAGLGTIIAIQSSKKIKLSSFFGFEVKAKTSTDEKLITSGWYARMRHPLYAAFILIFLGYFLVAGTATSGLHLVCLLLYLPFGIFYEEQNLLLLFGREYRVYQQKVPALFPNLKK